MAIGAYLDVEVLVKSWLATTPVAALVPRAGGGFHIYQAMPIGAPLPSVIVSRVGGAPARRSDVPADVARISMDIFAASRPLAVAIAQTLVAAVENLAQTGAYVTGSSRLEAGEVVSWIWLPDPTSDTARYVVDGLFTAVAS
jgi:hypothetical protein